MTRLSFSPPRGEGGGGNSKVPWIHLQMNGLFMPPVVPEPWDTAGRGGMGQASGPASCLSRPIPLSPAWVPGQGGGGDGEGDDGFGDGEGDDGFPTRGRQDMGNGHLAPCGASPSAICYSVLSPQYRGAAGTSPSPTHTQTPPIQARDSMGG